MVGSVSLPPFNAVARFPNLGHGFVRFLYGVPNVDKEVKLGLQVFL